MSTPDGNEMVLPSGSRTARPFTTSFGPLHTATVVWPILVPIAWLTDASGHVGAPDTCRACTSKSGPTCASSKSPTAWKSYARPATVCAWTSPMVLAAAQFMLAPPTVSSTNIMAGPGDVGIGAGVQKLRLFFSAVKPVATQSGAAVPP